MRSRRIPIMLVSLVLALLASAATALAAERTVAVSASATIKVPNDTARAGFSVSKERRTRGAALRAASAKLRRVIAAVQGIPGVGPGDVKTGRISVRKTFRGKRPVYRASEGVGVTLHQPEHAGDLLSAAIAAGATGVSGPTYFVGDSETAFGKALTAAFEKAKAKAATLAAAAGATLGEAITIDEGDGGEFVFGAPNKTEESSAGCGSSGPVAARATSSACTGSPPPVKPGTSTVTATVSVVFALR